MTGSLYVTPFRRLYLRIYSTTTQLHRTAWCIVTRIFPRFLHDVWQSVWMGCFRFTRAICLSHETNVRCVIYTRYNIFVDLYDYNWLKDIGLWKTPCMSSFEVIILQFSIAYIKPSNRIGRHHYRSRRHHQLKCLCIFDSCIGTRAVLSGFTRIYFTVMRVLPSEKINTWVHL